MNPSVLRTDRPDFSPTLGDVIRLLATEVLIVDIGALHHTAGYGPVEIRGIDLSSHLSPGTMLNTPWGMVEIVSAKDGRYQAMLASHLRGLSLVNLAAGETPV